MSYGNQGALVGFAPNKSMKSGTVAGNAQTAQAFNLKKYNQNLNRERKKYDTQILQEYDRAYSGVQTEYQTKKKAISESYDADILGINTQFNDKSNEILGYYNDDLANISEQYTAGEAELLGIFNSNNADIESQYNAGEKQINEKYAADIANLDTQLTEGKAAIEKSYQDLKTKYAGYSGLEKLDTQKAAALKDLIKQHEDAVKAAEKDKNDALKNLQKSKSEAVKLTNDSYSAALKDLQNQRDTANKTAKQNYDTNIQSLITSKNDALLGLKNDYDGIFGNLETSFNDSLFNLKNQTEQNLKQVNDFFMVEQNSIFSGLSIPKGQLKKYVPEYTFLQETAKQTAKKTNYGQMKKTAMSDLFFDGGKKNKKGGLGWIF